MLTFCPMPRLNAEGGGFISISECQALMEKGDSLKTELKDLQKIRQQFYDDDTELETKSKSDQKLVKLFVNWSKLRRVIRCNGCRAPRCVFSRYAPGNAKGPKKKHFDALDKLIEERGYRCGDRVRIYGNGTSSPDSESNESSDEAVAADDENEDGSKEDANEEVEEEPMLFCKEALSCGMAVESHYYPSGKNPTKGNRLKTRQICFNCYSDNKLVDDADVEEECDRGGRTYLPMCKGCLNAGVPVAFRKGVRRNVMQANAEKKRKKSQTKGAWKRGKQY